MTKWSGYFVCERQNIGAANWAQLITLFVDMGTHDSKFPVDNTHSRARRDGDAVLYESAFNPGEVSGIAFRQLLADEFGVPVEDVGQTITQVTYVTIPTIIWTYDYAGSDRFIVRRFGDGAASWEQSRVECLGYLKLNQALW